MSVEMRCNCIQLCKKYINIRDSLCVSVEFFAHMVLRRDANWKDSYIGREKEETKIARRTQYE